MVARAEGGAGTGSAQWRSAQSFYSALGRYHQRAGRGCAGKPGLIQRGGLLEHQTADYNAIGGPIALPRKRHVASQRPLYCLTLDHLPDAFSLWLRPAPLRPCSTDLGWPWVFGPGPPGTCNASCPADYLAMICCTSLPRAPGLLFAAPWSKGGMAHTGRPSAESPRQNQAEAHRRCRSKPDWRPGRWRFPTPGGTGCRSGACAAREPDAPDPPRRRLAAPVAAGPLAAGRLTTCWSAAPAKSAPGRTQFWAGPVGWPAGRYRASSPNKWDRSRTERPTR